MNVSKMHDQIEWLSPKQAADSSGSAASEASFRRWAQRGLIEAIQLPNGHWRISKAAVEELLEPVPATPVDGVPTLLERSA